MHAEQCAKFARRIIGQRIAKLLDLALGQVDRAFEALFFGQHRVVGDSVVHDLECGGAHHDRATDRVPTRHALPVQAHQGAAAPRGSFAIGLRRICH